MLDKSLLLEPQKEHAHKLLDSLYTNGTAIDMSEMGTGKTYCSAWIAKNHNVPVVVICPKIVIKNWNDTLAEFGIKPHAIVNYEKIIRGNNEYLQIEQTTEEIEQKNGKTFTKIHVQYNFNFPKNALVILDEAHKCKGLSTKNSKMLVQLKKNGYKCLLLSGSLATNPTEMRALGFIANLHNFHDFNNWLKTLNIVRNKHGGLSTDENAEDDVRRIMGYIHDDMFNEFQIASRMTKDQFLGFFPDNHIEADCFDIGRYAKHLENVYLTMEKELAKLEERSENYSQHHFAIMIKARREAELLKTPAMVNMIYDKYHSGKSPILFLNFNDSIEGALNLLKNKGISEDTIGFVRGNQKDQQEHIDNFYEDKKRIMLVNLKAGNLGINLGDYNGKYPRDTVISPTWSAIDMVQSFGRAPRAKAVSPVHQSVFFAAGTIEERVCNNVKNKLDNLDKLNDGDLTLTSFPL